MSPMDLEEAAIPEYAFSEQGKHNNHRVSFVDSELITFSRFRQFWSWGSSHSDFTRPGIYIRVNRSSDKKNSHARLGKVEGKQRMSLIFLLLLRVLG